MYKSNYDITIFNIERRHTSENWKDKRVVKSMNKRLVFHKIFCTKVRTEAKMLRADGLTYGKSELHKLINIPRLWLLFDSIRKYQVGNLYIFVILYEDNILEMLVLFTMHPYNVNE